MKAHITEPTRYESDIKVVDIDVASEEEDQLSCPGLSKVCRKSLVSKGPYRGFFVVAVMTFSGPDLPVGTDISFADTKQSWTVIAKNKAARHVRFDPEEYEEDEAKLKAKLREWAEKNGIVFEDSKADVRNGDANINNDNINDPGFGDNSFSNFVVGECNSFAFKAAVSVTENLGARNSNPILIWGKPGQGKTHLLKAMASSICEKHPEKEVLYVTGEEFTNEFIVCIKNKDYTGFREKYRKADCLILDDIQFFKNKEGIQTELYNTAQTLLDAHRQLVLSSEIAPSSLESIINPGLANMFLSGLVINIQSPNFYTRRITE